MLHVCMCVRATVLNTALSLVPALSTLVVVLVIVTVVAAKQLVSKIDNAHAFIIIIIFVTSASHLTSVVLLLLFYRGTKRFGRRRKPCHSILGSTQKNSDPEWDGGWANGRERESERATYAPAICHHRFHSHMLAYTKLPPSGAIRVDLPVFYPCCSLGFIGFVLGHHFEQGLTVPSCFVNRSVRWEYFFRFVLPVARSLTHTHTHSSGRVSVIKIVEQCCGGARTRVDWVVLNGFLFVVVVFVTGDQQH